MCKSVKSKSVIFFMLLLVVSAISVVNASANNSDTPWSYSCQSASSYTEYREKENTSYVYCQPESGHATYVTVEGAYNYYGSGNGEYSGRHYIGINVPAFISNYVNENSRGYARLHLERTVSDNTLCTGVWSPDSVWQSNAVYFY